MNLPRETCVAHEAQPLLYCGQCLEEMEARILLRAAAQGWQHEATGALRTLLASEFRKSNGDRVRTA